ncbi:MAG: hypothetical protein LH702_11815 [Phormidesmis sp. CAN_BIN44]|nr:hypothetical protein [Phormidesmis sp. CAN_BIN44]
MSSVEDSSADSTPKGYSTEAWNPPRKLGFSRTNRTCPYIGSTPTIIANGGFDGGGTLILGSGKDTVKGFGNQTLVGGGGTDTLVVPSGSYTVAIGMMNDTLMSGGLTMKVSKFFNLTVGNNPMTYKFATLTNNQMLTG